VAGLRGSFLTSGGTISDQIADFSDAAPSRCAVKAISGTKLVVESSREFPLGAPVKVSSQNHLWMGEVWACEPHANGFLVEIEVDATLKDVHSVDDLAARFRHERVIRMDGDTGKGKA
jgi:hypothetical protein